MVSESIPDYWCNWGLDKEEFNHIIHKNSNALSGIFGYVAEERVRKMFLEYHPLVSDLRTPEDQDRSDKGDWAFKYKGEPMKIEVKSLQTRTIEEVDNEDIDWRASFHLKGTSDQRSFKYDGDTYQTTLMDVDNSQVDIIAVNLYKLKNEWDFAFIKVDDLPRSKGNYPEGLKQQLAQSSIGLTIPLQEPYTDNPYELMDEIIEENEKV